LHRGGVLAERDLDVVLADGAVGQRHKPNHVRVRGREVLGLDVGKGSEDGVLTSRWVDVDAVAGDPSEQLRFRLHKVCREVGKGLGASKSQRQADFPLRVGRQAVPAPVQFGFRRALSRDSEIPNLKHCSLSRCDREDHSNSRLGSGAKHPELSRELNGSGDSPPLHA